MYVLCVFNVYFMYILYIFYVYFLYIVDRYIIYRARADARALRARAFGTRPLYLFKVLRITITGQSTRAA